MIEGRADGVSLESHIQDQQDRACILEGLLEGLLLLDNEGHGGEAITAIAQVSKEIASEIGANLDSIKLREVSS